MTHTWMPQHQDDEKGFSHWKHLLPARHAPGYASAGSRLPGLAFL